MFQTIIPLFGIIRGVKFFPYTVFAFFVGFAALGAGTPAKPAAPSATLPAKSAKTPKKQLIPASEWKMIRQIAVNYDLRLEFGVGGPMDSGHKAHRYRDGVKSFYVQGYWAAGTIRKHYTGDLTAFGKRYNPPHAAKWTTAVTSLIKRLKAENNSTLPGVKPAKKVIDLP